MEAKQYLQVLGRWWWLVLLAAGLSGAISYWYSSKAPALFRSTTTVRVGLFLQSTEPQNNDLYTSTNLAQSYAQLVARHPILQATIDALKLETSWTSLAGRVSAVAPANSQMIQISVVDADPQQAQRIANALAQQLIAQSPTQGQETELAQQRQFVQQQLDDISAKVTATQKEIGRLQEAQSEQTSALALQDAQSQITVLQQRITNWQGTYASLLDFYKGSRTNVLSVLDPATLPAGPVGSETRRNTLLAVIAGALLAVVGGLVVEYLDDSIKVRDDVERTLQLPVLGAITRIRRAGRSRTYLLTKQGLRSELEAILRRHRAGPSADHLVMKQGLSSVAEAYRVLRTAVLRTATGNPATTLLVTSAQPGEGKSTTACNLAMAMAQAGEKVLLVDASLRQPHLHTLLGLRPPVAGQVPTPVGESPGEGRRRPRRGGARSSPGGPTGSGVKVDADRSNAADNPASRTAPAAQPRGCGLSNLLLDERLPIETTLWVTETPHLSVLPAGPPAENAAELLASELMKRRLAEMKAHADVVIFDGPPALPLADALILGALCHEALLVVAARRTRAKAAWQARSALEQFGVRIAGVVLNRCRRARDGYPQHSPSSDAHAQGTPS